MPGFYACSSQMLPPGVSKPVLCKCDSTDFSCWSLQKCSRGKKLTLIDHLSCKKLGLVTSLPLLLILTSVGKTTLQYDPPQMWFHTEYILYILYVSYPLLNLVHKNSLGRHKGLMFPVLCITSGRGMSVLHRLSLHYPRCKLRYITDNTDTVVISHATDEREK